MAQALIPCPVCGRPMHRQRQTCMVCQQQGITHAAPAPTEPASAGPVHPQSGSTGGGPPLPVLLSQPSRPDARLWIVPVAIAVLALIAFLLFRGVEPQANAVPAEYRLAQGDLKPGVILYYWENPGVGKPTPLGSFVQLTRGSFGSRGNNVPAIEFRRPDGKTELRDWIDVSGNGKYFVKQSDPNYTE